MGGWNDVQRLVERVQDDYQDRCNEEKANMLRDELDRMFANGTFYVVVYDHCGGYGNHAFSHHNNNFIFSFRRGGCNVVVFRSFRDHERGVYARRLEERIKNRTYPSLNSYKDFIGNVHDELGSDCGFVGMIKTSYNAHIRFVNCDLNDIPNGPGAYTVVETPMSKHEFWVIAGIR